MRCGSDKSSVTRFSERALQILEAAEAAAASGAPCSDVTILVSTGGAIHMLTGDGARDADWPLDRLLAYHGAASAFRVTWNHGRIQVEAREGQRTCRLEGTTPQSVARALLRPLVGNFLEGSIRSVV